MQQLLHRVSRIKKEWRKHKNPPSKDSGFPCLMGAMKKSWKMVGVLGVMVFGLWGLFGCGKPKEKIETKTGQIIEQTVEEMAKQYLEEKYHKNFTISEMILRGNGPIGEREYFGYAYEEGDCTRQFTVWVDKIEKKAFDTYYTLSLLPAINEWVQEEADKQWQDVKTKTILEVYRYSEEKSYTEDNIAAFFQNESVRTSIHMAVPEEDVTVERCVELSEALKNMDLGIIKIYCLEKEQMQNIDWNEIIDRKEEFLIFTGDDEEAIRKALEQRRK